ncbi:MAG: family 78 glycoside hydrolase catalytic domain, partial [Chitinophagaceae bacterium]
MKRLPGCLLFSFLFINTFAQRLSVVNPRCEFKQNPIGVDATSPSFSWELQSSQQNVLQTAYRILVADDSLLLLKNIANAWDSKKIISSASIQVKYNGKPLLSTKKYYWKVIVNDNKGNTASATISNWRMGLLSVNDWKNASWIAYDILPDSNKIVPAAHGNGKKAWGKRKDILPLLRKDFSINKPVKNAMVFICGLGQFEMSVNGEKTGDHFLDPGWTQYSKHALYVSFDITRQLKQGANAVGVMLGNGFYYVPGERYRKITGGFGYPKMICRFVIEYEDGTTQNIISDQTWKTAPSPIIFSSIYSGEDYDATLEQDGWNEPGFNDTKWKNAEITTGPTILQSQMADALKVMEHFPGNKKPTTVNDAWVYDLGQNFSGIPSITVSGNKADTIRIYPAELLNEDGSANQKGTGGPSYFTYILKGNGQETWQPRFTYYGFRYLEVHGAIPQGTVNAQSLPSIINIEGLHTRNGANTVGSFSCSNDLFNKTNELINWAIKSNTVSVFTDCPHREKLGWLEQTHLMGSSVQYNYDIANLNKKVIRDMINAQTADGLIPEISPEFVQFEDPFRDSPEWGSAAIILPWYNYQWYGDKAALAEAYDMMKRYIGYLQSKAIDNILSQGLGDWYDIGPDRPGVSQLTPKGVTATAMYYYDLTMMMSISKLLGKAADQNKYSQMAVAVKRSFNEHFFDKKTYQYASGSQTANAMALYMKLVDPVYKQLVLANLVKDIRNRNNALTAGDIGYRYVLRALEEEGRSDIIYDMNSRSDVPGYGYQLAHGATALTESWQAYPSVSNNHFMLGHLMEWFYAGLAGIKNAENGIAFKNMEIRPQPVGDVTKAEAS